MLQITLQNIEESLKQLPYSLQVEVFHYIEFLKSNYAKQSLEDSEVKRLPRMLSQLISQTR